jgi:glutamyl-tRNA synthetase
MILGPDGTRLSKRHGATSVTSFRDEGFLPEAMVNFLALLGWAYDGEREIFTMEELTQFFSLERISKNPAIFNYEKLEWMNGEYFRALPLGRRTDLVIDHLRASKALPESALKDRTFARRRSGGTGSRPRTSWTTRLPLRRSRRARAGTVAGFRRSPASRPACGSWPGTRRVAPFEHDPLEQATRGVAQAEGVKAGEVIMPARIALTGKKVTPGIFDVMLLLGRQRTVQRLIDAADRLEAASPAPAG